MRRGAAAQEGMASGTHYAPKHECAGLSVWLPGAVMIGSVTFNAVLAIVNGHVVHLSPSAVIGMEVAFVIAAHAVAAVRLTPEMMPWYLLLVLLGSFAAVRVVLTGEFGLGAKYFRDVLLIPTFVVLGMTARDRDLDRSAVVLFTIVFAVFLLEILAPTIYQDLFQIKDYYINTRHNAADEFWNSHSDLYLSATRPGDRFIDVGDLPRASSLFVEPVSLGNYCTLMTAFICARFSGLSRRVRLFTIVGLVLMLIGCDGRLALVSSTLIVLLSVFFSTLSTRFAIFYLPLALLFAVGVTSIRGPQSGDDFVGRINYTVTLLGEFGLIDWLGLSSQHIASAADSGLAYLIISQSVFGLLVVWCFFILYARDVFVDQIRFTHGLALFLSMTMMVSYSIVTIKTAAFMWFIYGALHASDSVDTAPSRESHNMQKGTF